MGVAWCFLGYLAAGLLMGELTCRAFRRAGQSMTNTIYLTSVFLCRPLFVPGVVLGGLSGRL